MTAPVRPILRYAGAKWRIAPWIVSHLPPHEVYLEPFCGSCAVLFAKPRAWVETVNDLDGAVVGFFRVLRDRPEALAAAIALTPYARAEFETSDGPPTGDELEDARRFAVRVWMAYGGKLGTTSGWSHDMRGGRRRTSSPTEWAGVPARLRAVVDRLTGVHIEGRPALDVIAAQRHPRVLIYADPPYVRSTRADRIYYRHELTDADHGDLLDALDAHPGPVVISGYRSPLYDDRLRGWRMVERRALANGGGDRTEVVWLNPRAAATARQAPLMEAE